MKKLVSLVILSVGLLGLCLCQKVYYVKPAGPSSPECPSGNLPCHSLQYYANHSNFTNNSLFRFLPGEHHLDSVVGISKVSNLSLEGVGSGVKILCHSHPSGFNIREFAGLSLKKMTVLNCLHSNVSLNLESGSELCIDDVTVSGGYAAAIGLQVISVTGSLNISNSFFPAFQDGSIVVNFTYCTQPSFLNFSSNEVETLKVDIRCSNVHMLLADIISLASDYSFNFCVLTNISLLVSNSSFNDSVMLAQCSSDCKMKDDHCTHDLIALKQITFISSKVTISEFPTESCTIAIEDSVFVNRLDSLKLISSYSDCNLSQSMDDIFIQAKLNNVTFVEATCYLQCIVILFVNCSFMNNKESAIQASTSKVFFQGYNLIKNNSAPLGAGLSLINSYLFLQPHTYVLFEDNHADYMGGAIYTSFMKTELCFYHIVNDYSPLNETIEVDFVNNTADLGGSSLFGDSILYCINLHDFFSNISNTELTPSAVALSLKYLYGVCFCEKNKNQPNCSDMNKSKTVQIFPGESFILRLALVDALGGVLTGVVRAYFNSSSSATLEPLQSIQAIHKPHCQNFTYTIYSTDGTETEFMLSPELLYLAELITDFPDLTVNVTFKECPIGFVLSTTGSCDCNDILLKNGIACDIGNQSISQPANTWIGFVKNLSDTNLLFHPHCPIGYCLPYDTSITSNTSDSQCAPHRTGLLCGKCEEGYSLTLGNGTCATCSNTYLLLILPLAVSGLLLVAILFALNLTVTEGTINGLIFYANVMGMNHSTLYSGEANWLYTFLAWLNLDLGIGMCFYDGMDSYAETWLQFVFPVYLWTIILVIIKLYSRFPTLANRLGGGNAVKVLATLLVLSYTKLQRTVVTIMSFTTLEYPDGSVHYVWLYDGNVDYFKGKHLYLGFAGIFALVFLIFPYTLCLVFFQQLQACSNRFPFQWVNKLKPLFDSYAGPYKDRYRFWTGMLLLVRTLLIVLFTANTSGSVEFNLFIILIVSLALSLAGSNGVYKKWPLNYLETFFYLQLGVFAGGIKITPGNASLMANASIGLSLAILIVILGYHFVLILKASKGYCYHLVGYADIIDVNDAVLSYKR